MGNMSYTMEMNMKGNGSRIYLMVKEYIDGKMVQFIKVSIRIIKEMVKVNTHGQMETSIMEIGIIVTKKVKEQ